MNLQLNGFYVDFSKRTFIAHVGQMPPDVLIEDLRDEHRDEWCLQVRKGLLYGLPKVASPTYQFGEPREFSHTAYEAMHLLSSRVTEQLPEAFPNYTPQWRRPFTILSRKTELVAEILEDLPDIPHVFTRLRIVPQMSLEPKIIEMEPGALALGLFLSVKMRWEAHVGLDELIEAGVNVNGMYAIWRNPPPQQRRLVGRVDSVSGSFVRLSESSSSSDRVPIGDVWPEGSLSTFATCFRTTLGSNYQRFTENRFVKEGEFFTGRGHDRLLADIHSTLRNHGAFQLSPGFACAVKHRIFAKSRSDYDTVVRFSPVEHCFNPSRTHRHVYAWNGLEKYGPHSYDSMGVRSPSILVVCPTGAQGQVDVFVQKLLNGVSVPSSDGFQKGISKLFGFVNTTIDFCLVGDGGGETNTHKAYTDAITRHLSERTSDYNLALVFLDPADKALPDSVNPYLASRAVLLTSGIPVQEVLLSTLRQSPSSLPYTLRNISVAVYAKLGGVPWTVSQDETLNDELVVGMGTAELSGSRFDSRQRYIGITTVFSGDGNYLLSNLSSECAYEDYPAILQATMTDILQTMKARNGWKRGDNVRIVFHAYKPLKNAEVTEIIHRSVETLGKEQNIQFAFLTVTQDHTFRLLDLDQKGNGRTDAKGGMIPDRGVMVHLGKYTRLLCVAGPQQIRRPGLPAPVLVHLHRGSTYTDLTYLTEQVLKFTSLSWRSVYPGRNPVTITYSELIADQLARLKNVPGWSPLPLRTKLQASRWFL